MSDVEKPGLLLVANWDSDVGYAWWLMEAYWLKLYREYSSSYAVFLAYPSISKLPKLIAQSGIHVEQMDFSQRGAAALRSQFRYIRSRKIEVIYFSDYPHLSIRYAMLRLIGVKHLLVHDHTPGHRAVPALVKRIIKTALNRISLLTPNAMIGATEFVRKRIISVTRFPSKKAYVVRNGLRLDAICSGVIDVCELFDIPRSRIIMVCASRATRYKGIDFAIRCIGRIVHRNPDSPIHFLFFGDGPDFKELKELAEQESVSSRVTFAGRQSELILKFRSCDFAIHPSRGEVGYSLSILEYMAAKLPVLVPDNPSVSSAIDELESGRIFKEGCINSACEMIEWMIRSPDRRLQMGLKAHAIVHRKYSLDQGEQDLVDVFNTLGI